MSKRFNFAINKLSLDGLSTKKLNMLLNDAPYSDDSGVGILESNSESNVVSSLLLKRLPTFIDAYNQATGELEKSQIFVFKEVVFYVDIKYSLVYSMGNSTSLSYVRSLLKSILGEVSFTATDISPYKVFNKFLEEEVQATVEEVCINEYNLNNRAIGKFTAKILDAEIAGELVDLYKEDVVRIVFNIQEEYGNSFTLFIHNNNALSITCDPDDVSSNFETIKSILF